MDVHKTLANQWLEATRQFLWLDSDSTRPSHDSDADSTIFKWLWLEGLVTLTRQKWLGHITADHRKGSTSQNSEKKLRSDSESLDVMDVYTSQKNENTPKNLKTQQPKEY